MVSRCVTLAEDITIGIQIMCTYLAQIIVPMLIDRSLFLAYYEYTIYNYTGEEGTLKITISRQLCTSS